MFWKPISIPITNQERKNWLKPLAHKPPSEGRPALQQLRFFWKTDRNRLSFNGYGADVVGSAELRRNAPVIAFITQQGSDNNTRFHLNGKDGGGGPVGLSGYANKAITIGANNAGAEKTAADFAEVLIYSRALHPNERAALGYYLGSKYGIEGDWNPAPPEIMNLASRNRVERSEQEHQKLFNYFMF